MTFQTRYERSNTNKKDPFPTYHVMSYFIYAVSSQPDSTTSFKACANSAREPRFHAQQRKPRSLRLALLTQIVATPFMHSLPKASNESDVNCSPHTAFPTALSAFHPSRPWLTHNATAIKALMASYPDQFITTKCLSRHFSEWWRKLP